MDPQLRHLKDFLSLYNKVTELCFNRCVDNLYDRQLSKYEDVCVSRCVSKFAGFNQAMMKAYVEVQAEINVRRMKEMEDAQKQLEEQQQDSIKDKQKQQQETESKATILTTPKPSGDVKMAM